MPFSKYLASLLLLLVSASPSFSQAEQPKRLVFFDVFVSSQLPDLKPSAKFLSRALANELVKLSGILVMDQGTRDSLLLQRKFNLDDCAKTECRFAMAKALPGVEYMLETEIEPFGKSCAVTMRIKSVKKGSIVSSQLEQAACEPEALLAAVRKAASNIHPDGNRQRLPKDDSRGREEMRPQAKAFLGEHTTAAFNLPKGEAVELPVAQHETVASMLSQGAIFYTKFGEQIQVRVDDGTKTYECTISNQLFCVIRGLKGQATVTFKGAFAGKRTYDFLRGKTEIAAAPRTGGLMACSGSFLTLSSLAAGTAAVLLLSDDPDENAGAAAGLFTLGIVGTGVGLGITIWGIGEIGEPPLHLKDGSAAKVLTGIVHEPTHRSQSLYTISPTATLVDDQAVVGLRLSF